MHGSRGARPHEAVDRRRSGCLRSTRLPSKSRRHHRGGTDPATSSFTTMSCVHLRDAAAAANGDTVPPASGSATIRTAPSTLASPIRCRSSVIDALRRSTSRGSVVPHAALIAAHAPMDVAELRLQVIEKFSNRLAGNARKRSAACRRTPRGQRSDGDRAPRARRAPASTQVAANAVSLQVSTTARAAHPHAHASSAMRSRNASSAMGSVTVSVRHWPPSSTAIVYARASGAGGARLFPAIGKKFQRAGRSCRSRAVCAGGSASQSIETGLASPGKRRSHRPSESRSA